MVKRVRAGVDADAEVDAFMAQLVEKPKRSALATPLDGNAEVRAVLIKRLLKTSERAPVALLHQITTMLEDMRW